ncbi:hypothetical protein GOV14_00285 [Candidatus Pacearchaeota archaeon]|nr:hypothetical protein [Candidatus Pacearchaeota archaeon]
MDKEKLILELEQKFDETKKDLGFKATFKELDSIFFITDFILEVGFVSDRFSRQLSHRIGNTYVSWLGTMQDIVSPNPHNPVLLAEVKNCDDQDRKDAHDLIKVIMKSLRQNALIGVTKNKKEEKEFIDDSVNNWNKVMKPKITKLYRKFVKNWS